MKKFIKTLKRLLKKHLNKPQFLPYNQIDSHKWESKMEMQHTLSQKVDFKPLEK